MSLSARPSTKRRKMYRTRPRPKTSNPKKSSLSIQIEGMERQLKSLHPKKRKFSVSTLRSIVQERSNLTSLRRENSELKKNLSRMIQQSMNCSGNAINQNTTSYHSQQRMTAEQRKLEKLDRRVHSLRMLYDQLRSSRRVLEKTNLRKLDILRDLELEARPVLDENPKMSKRIITLETQLDRTLIKYNEVMERNERGLGILNKLRREQRQFDHRLNEIEKSLVEKSSDCEHLKKMCVKARAMKEKARASLHELLNEVRGLKSRKEREITRKMRFVGEKIALTKRMTCREERRRNVQYFGKEMIHEKQPHGNLLMKYVVNKINDRVGHRLTLCDKKRLEHLERKYMRLRELTFISASTNDEENLPNMDSKYQYHNYITSSEKVYEGIIRKLSQLYEKRMKLNENVEEARERVENSRKQSHSLSKKLNSLITESMIHSSSIRTSQRLLENMDNMFNNHGKHLEELKKEFLELKTMLSNLSLFLSNMNHLCEDMVSKLFRYEDSTLHIEIPNVTRLDDEEERLLDGYPAKENEHFSKIKETLSMLSEFGNYAFEIYRKFKSFFVKKKKPKKEEVKMSEKFRRTSNSSIGDELEEEEMYEKMEMPDISKLSEFSISNQNIRIEIPGEDDGEDGGSIKARKEIECVDRLFTKICRKEENKEDEEPEEDQEKIEYFDTEVEEIFDRNQIKFMSRLAVIRGKKRASFQAKMKDLEGEKRKQKRGMKFWKIQVPVVHQKIEKKKSRPPSRGSAPSTSRSKRKSGRLSHRQIEPMSPKEILLQGEKFVDVYQEDYLYDEIIDDYEGEDDGEFVLPH